jgi:cytochrome c oxidase subunit 2
LFTAADVLHSWLVPALGWKTDTIPGFINESWTYVEKAGTYRGQCAELCGKDHGFMPIVVIAMDKPDYDIWVQSQQVKAEIETAAADKVWSKDNLMAKGKEVYTNNCASCHMGDGSGMAGTFPAITKSALVTGDIDNEINIVMKGQAMMPAFGTMLSAVDFAAVVTYTRNNLGNAVGDLVQPSKIKSLQASLDVNDDDDDE